MDIIHFGFLAYFGILGYPFFIGTIRKIVFHLMSFYYVGFVMIMTFLAGICGEFVGPDPEVFHFIGLGIVLISFEMGGIQLYQIRSR